jgi:hypothetical protein
MAKKEEAPIEKKKKMKKESMQEKMPSGLGLF